MAGKHGPVFLRYAVLFFLCVAVVAAIFGTLNQPSEGPGTPRQELGGSR